MSYKQELQNLHNYTSKTEYVDLDFYKLLDLLEKVQESGKMTVADLARLLDLGVNVFLGPFMCRYQYIIGPGSYRKLKSNLAKIHKKSIWARLQGILRLP